MFIQTDIHSFICPYLYLSLHSAAFFISNNNNLFTIKEKSNLDNVLLNTLQVLSGVVLQRIESIDSQLQHDNPAMFEEWVLLTAIYGNQLYFIWKVWKQSWTFTRSSIKWNHIRIWICHHIKPAIKITLTSVTIHPLLNSYMSFSVHPLKYPSICSFIDPFVTHLIIQ